MRFSLHSLLLVLLLGSVGFPGTGAAQIIPGAGARVRVSNNSGQVIIGTVQESSADAITVLAEPNDMNVHLPFADMRKLERHYRGKQQFAKYFVISVVSIGTVVGAAAALMGANECGGDFLCSPSANFAVGAMAGGVVGIPVGIIAGLSIREHGWLRVDLPESNRVTLSIGPAARRPGAAVTGISISTR